MLGPWATAGVVFAIGFVVALAGDATHVAAGTTVYKWDDVPEIWNSAIWFPFAVAGAVFAAAFISERLGMPAVRARTRADLVTGAAAVLALYGLTAALKGQPETVSVVLTGALAVLIWSWWDPSPGALLTATFAAIVGPLAEIGVVELGASEYTPTEDGLAGVAPWLPCLYFAAGAVASRMWAAVARDGQPVARHRRSL